jgi:anti-sigma factor RsiW
MEFEQMKCEQVRKLLSDYVDQALPATESAELASHLAGCPGCAKEHGRVVRLVTEMKGLRGAMAPWDLWPGVQRRLQIAALKPDSWRAFSSLVRRPLVMVPALGTVAAVVGIGLISLLGGGHPPPGAQADAKFYTEYARAYSRYRSQQSLADVDALTAAVELGGSSLPAEAVK